MRKSHVFSLVVLAVTSCSSGPMSSPTATYRTQNKAFCEKDTVTYRKTWATVINDKLQEYIKTTKFNSLDEYYKDELDELSKRAKCTEPEIRNEKITGDKASIETRIPGGEWLTSYFLKEGDEWKMTLAIPKSMTSSASSMTLSSPTASYEANYDAWQRKDVEAYKKTLSRNSLQRLDEIAKEKSMRVDDLLRNTMQNSPRPYLLETRNEKINGDTATLEAKEEKGEWKIVPLVKENGEWKWGR